MVGTGLRGGGGFESGGERHIGTLEYHVTSSPPHSQGEQFNFFLSKQIIKLLKSVKMIIKMYVFVNVWSVLTRDVERTKTQ